MLKHQNCEPSYFPGHAAPLPAHGQKSFAEGAAVVFLGEEFIKQIIHRLVPAKLKWEQLGQAGITGSPSKVFHVYVSKLSFFERVKVVRAAAAQQVWAKPRRIRRRAEYAHRVLAEGGWRKSQLPLMY